LLSEKVILKARFSEPFVYAVLTASNPVSELSHNRLNVMEPPSRIPRFQTLSVSLSVVLSRSEAVGFIEKLVMVPTFTHVVGVAVAAVPIAV